MKPADAAALLSLGALWGASFLFIRAAAPVLGPLVLPELRVILAGAALAVFAALSGRRLALRRRWRRYLALGAVNAAIPFALVAAAAERGPISLLAIGNATVPFFTALVAAVWLGERLTRRIVAGCGLGLVGVAVLVGWSPLRPSDGLMVAAGCTLLAALCYAIGGVYAGRAFPGARPLDLAAGQQVAAGGLLLAPALADAPAAPPPARIVLAVAALALPCTAVAYLLYFRLIERVGPTATHTVTFLVPGFALLWSVLLVGEEITRGTVGALALVLAGVALVTGVGLPRTGSRLGRARPAAGG